MVLSATSDFPCIEVGISYPARSSSVGAISSSRAPVTSPCKRTVGGSQDERPELGVIAVVGPGVVFEDVDRRIADAADRSPVEGAEVDDQVRRNVLDRVIDLLGLEDQCSQRLCHRVRWWPRILP